MLDSPVGSVSDALPQALGQVLGDIAGALDFVALLDQHGRLLKVETALPNLALIPEKMVYHEAMNQPFMLTLDCLSTSAYFDLKDLLGEQISLRLLQADGSYKAWHGYVTLADQLGSDGGYARYRLAMQPWLSFLGYRLDSFVYQNKTALDIIEDIFKDYSQANYRVAVTETLRVRSLCQQYRESDLEFVQRLLAEEGLVTWYEHADVADLSSGQASHVLVIADREATHPDLGEVRFTSQSPVANVEGQRDAITAFMAERRVAANAVTLGSWDYKNLSGTSAQDQSSLDIGSLPALEVYDGSGAYRYQDSEHAQRAAAIALAGLELHYKHFEGQGSARYFESGRNFSLVDHPLYGANTTALNYAGALTASHQRPDNEFTLLAVEHHATNNLGAQVAKLLKSTELEHGTYKNHFYAVPAAAPIVPKHIRKPTAPAEQTALVVGISGEALTTERDQRVKIQFPWQRGQSPNPGGLPHQAAGDSNGNAPGDDSSGTWVRVAMPSAGANWGATFTPRINSEVVVSFIEGDIDRPVVSGSLYNGQDTPPFAAGVNSGANHPGVITGIHATSLDGADYTQWVMDDASGQLRMRLLASYHQSELHLGYLISHDAASASRGSWRGSGFELGTQGWASMRAAKGLLLSTTTRQGSYGSAQSTQMDAAEALAQLGSAQKLGQVLSDAANAGSALAMPSFAQGDSVDKLLTAIDPQQDGKHPASVNGQAAQKTSGFDRTLTDPVEAFAQPIVLLDTPSSAIYTTQASIAHYAGQNHSLAVQGDAHQAAAHTWASTSGQTTSWYTHEGGVKVYAANGPVSIQAHTDQLHILADQDVTVISVNNAITIQAQSKVAITGADSGIVFDGGNIDFMTPGNFNAKLSTHAFLGGDSGSVNMPTLPSNLSTLRPDELEVQYLYHDEEGVQGARYSATLGDGSTRSGSTDASGTAKLTGLPPGPVDIQFFPDARDWEQKDKTANDHADQSMDTVMSRYTSDDSAGNA